MERLDDNHAGQAVYLAAEGVISARAAAEYPILAQFHGPLDGLPVITCHPDRESLKVTTDLLIDGVKVRQTLATLDDIIADVQSRQNQDDLKRIQASAIEHAQAGIERLADILGNALSRDEIETRAMSGRPFEPAIFDPILLYDRPFETSPPTKAPENAATLPVLTGFWPSLWWFGWDNRARGCRIFGSAWLFENNWFGGRMAYVRGINGLIPLAPLFLDQAVSSVIVT